MWREIWWEWVIGENESDGMGGVDMAVKQDQ